MNNKKSATPVVDANARLYLWNNNNIIQRFLFCSLFWHQAI